MAISDVLSDAGAAIENYLEQEIWNDTYQGVIRQDIEWLLKRMDEVRAYLDTPPIPELNPKEPNFVGRYENKS